MKEFVEKLIERLEENTIYDKQAISFMNKYGRNIGFISKGKAIEIVKDLAEEHNNNVIIDEQYCWQTCGATEHCKECRRLSNGDIDYYENYDFMVEEHNNGWIPCSERLPQENEPVDAVCEVVNVMMKSGTVTSGWCNRYLERWYVLDEHCDYPLQQNYEDVIAWQPLPAPYKKGE